VVIWGNEHECQPELAETLVGTFRIYQPGSSIATSLVKTESAEFPKKFGILEIRGIKFRLKTHDFTQVRPFLFGEIKLQDMPQLDPQDPNVQEKVAAVLQKRIQSMIDEGREMSRAVEAGAQTLQLTNRVKEPSLILLRLRVEYEGFVSLNQQRFGALFVGKVANPSELLLFSKSKKYGGGKSGSSGAATARRSAQAAFIQGGDAEEGDDTSKISLDELVFTSLSRNSTLNILPSTEMETAINSFVVKKNANAIMDAVQHALEVAQDSIWKDKDAPSTRETISSAAAMLKSSVEGKAGSSKSSAKSAAIADLLASKPGSAMPGSDEDSVVKAPAKRGRAGAAKPVAKAAASGKRALSPEDDTQSQNDNDSIQDSDDVAPKRKGVAATRNTKAKASPARPSRAKAKKRYVQDDDSDEYGGGDDYVDEVDVSEEEEEEEEKPKARGRAASKKAAAAKKPAVKKAAVPAKRAPAKKKQIEEDTNDVMDLVSSDEEASKPTTSRARARPVDVDVSQVKLTAGYTPGNSSTQQLNDLGVGSGISISASGMTAPTRKRALPGALSQRSGANQDWD
jgi:double-strand break repair protein MRE11